MLDVLLPSAYFCDQIFTGLPAMPRLGQEVFSQAYRMVPGGGFIPALALTRLGVNVNWACDFGNDVFSRYVLEEAGRQHLDPALFRIHNQPLRSVMVACSFAHERAFLSYMDPLPEMDLSELVRSNPARCLLIMYFQYGVEFARTVQAARQQGSLVFMEGQVSGEASLADPHVQEALRSLDIFTLNREEALKLTGERRIEIALDRLADCTPLVVVKLGKDGALAARKEERVHALGIPTNVVDTTGAGDNFDCGFLYGLLHGYSLEDCLRCGNFCGGRSVTAQGGWEASPTASQLEEYLKNG